MIDFYVDFEFKSRLFQATIGAVFNKAVTKMIQAFEKRADALFGVE
jgi:coenzyme Q-binding protein COQ10